MKKRGLVLLILIFLVGGFIFTLLTITASPSVTLVAPAVSNSSHTSSTWIFVNITSNESLSQSLLEWGNSSGFTNLSMSNNSLVNWYLNMTNLVNYNYNYTIWAQNTSGNWSQSARYFATVDTIVPNINFIPPTPSNNSLQSTDSVYVNVSTNDTNNHSAFIDWNRDLVGWWTMDFYNLSAIYDNSSYNSFANFTGGLSAGNITSGKRGKALDFDGVNDYIQFSKENIFDFTTNFTLEAWIKPKGASALNAIMGKYVLLPQPSGWDWILQTGRPRMSARGTSSIDSSNQGSDLRDGNWHHIAVVVTNTYIQQYVDSVPLTRVNGNWIPITNDIYPSIGFRDAGLTTFNGSIDDFMIFRRALTPQEINASYNAGAYRLYNNFTSLNDGVYNYTAYAIDSAGNINSTTQQLTVDAPTQTYYVDATNGLDSNNGTSQDSAWKTISKVNSKIFNPGDSILFKRGEVWREQLTIQSSGYSGSPIIFGAYGTGSNPLINPTETVSNWSVYSGNIYVANVTSSVTQLFVDGIFYNLSFYPNTGFLNTTNDSGKTGLFDVNLTLTRDQIINSTVKVMTATWAIEERVASTYNDTTKTINWTSPTTYNIVSGYGYYLENKSWMLDSPGEWWYNSSSNQTYIWLQGDENPNNHNIEVSNQTYGIYAQNESYIQLANLTIEHTKGDSLYLEGINNSNISDLNINDSGNRFIYAHNSRNLTIESINGYRARIDGFALYSNEYLTVANNSLYHLGTVGKPVRSLGGVYLHWVNNTLFQNNFLYDMGYLGVWITGRDNLIDENIINRTCVNLDDCGSIMTQLSNLSANTISNNIITDSIGSPPMKKSGVVNEAAGIYLDDLSSRFQIINNTLINTGRGIFLHNSFNNTVIGNIVFNAAGAIVFREDSYFAGIIHDNNISNNIFHVNSIYPDYSSGILLGLLGSTSFGTIDYNYYSHPYLDSLAIKVLNVSLITTWFEFVYQYLPFYLWQQQSGQDVHSYDIADSYEINNSYTIGSYGSEGIINNNFNTSLNNWGQFPSDYEKDLVSNCPIGGGNCVLLIHNDSENLTHLINSNAFPLVQGQQYELRFKILSNTTTSVVPVIRRNAAPFDDLGFRNSRLILYGGVPVDYSAVFTAPVDVSNARLDIEFAINGTIFWLDDAYLTQVNNVTTHNQSDDFLLLYNTQTTPQSYSLNNNYLDVNGNTITGPIILQPYSSELLLAGFCNYDTSCNNRETYLTCPSDCSAPTTTPESNLGSGASSGGTVGCSYNWVCSEWASCPAEGIQKRFCINKGTCDGILNRPSLEQNCIPAKSLFDIFINIPLEYKWILHQNETKFNVELINKGNETTIDVTLKYWIAHDDGRLVTERQETRAIGKGDKFEITIPFEEKDLGIYYIYVQATYGNNQIAIAQDSFQIVRSNLEIFLREAFSFPYILIFFGLIIIVLLIIILLKKTNGKEAYEKPEKIKKITSTPKPEKIGFFNRLGMRMEMLKKERASRKLLRKLAKRKRMAEKENLRLQKIKKREYKKQMRLQKKMQRRLERKYGKNIGEEENMEKETNLAASEPANSSKKSGEKTKQKKRVYLQEDLRKQREV